MTNMTTAEMIAEYNALTGKNVKKFSSRAAGEKQLEKARYVAGLLDKMGEAARLEFVNAYGTDVCPVCGIHLSNGVLKHGVDGVKNETHEFHCMGCGAEFGPELKAKNDKLAEATSRSWSDSSVAAKRSQRDGVTVDFNGQEPKAYKSVRAAFNDLNLPDSKHIRFRMSLKVNKVGAFEHAGTVFNFKIV